MKKRPLPIKIISALLLIWAIYLLVISVIGIYESFNVDIDTLKQEDPEKWEELETKAGYNNLELNEGTLKTLALFGSFIIFLFAAFVFIVIMGVWYGKSWARIILIIILYGYTLFSIFGLFLGQILSIIDVVLGAFLGTYFLVNKKIIEFFQKK